MVQISAGFFLYTYKNNIVKPENIGFILGVEMGYYTNFKGHTEKITLNYDKFGDLVSDIGKKREIYSIDVQETIIETAVRELREETRGLVVIDYGNINFVSYSKGSNKYTFHGLAYCPYELIEDFNRLEKKSDKEEKEKLFFFTFSDMLNLNRKARDPRSPPVPISVIEGYKFFEPYMKDPKRIDYIEPIIIPKYDYGSLTAYEALARYVESEKQHLYKEMMEKANKEKKLHEQFISDIIDKTIKNIVEITEEDYETVLNNFDEIKRHYKLLKMN